MVRHTCLLILVVALVLAFSPSTEAGRKRNRLMTRGLKRDSKFRGSLGTSYNLGPVLHCIAVCRTAVSVNSINKISTYGEICKTQRARLLTNWPPSGGLLARRSASTALAAQRTAFN